MSHFAAARSNETGRLKGSGNMQSDHALGCNQSAIDICASGSKLDTVMAGIPLHGHVNVMLWQAVTVILNYEILP